jgi:hypothetical protein
MAEVPARPLDYANPQVFFEAIYRTRSLSTAIAALVCLSVATAMIYAVSRGGWPRGMPRPVALCVFALPLLSGLWCVWLCCLNRVTDVRITADGVTAESRFWPWSRINEVGASEFNRGGGVLLFVTLGGPRSWQSRFIWTTPLIPRDRYETLRVDLDHFFAARGLRIRTRDVTSDNGVVAIARRPRT